MFFLSNHFQKLEAVTRDSLSFQMENLMCHELLVIGLRSKSSLWVFRNHLSNVMSMVYNVVIAFMVLLQLPLQTQFKHTGHLGLTNVLYFQLIG